MEALTYNKTAERSSGKYNMKSLLVMLSYIYMVLFFSSFTYKFILAHANPILEVVKCKFFKRQIQWFTSEITGSAFPTVPDCQG